ncbi:MAG: DinB family protein [Edaphobacter sp.]
MSQPSLTAEDIMTWNERTSQEWRQLLTTHPEVLTLPCDIAGAKIVGELLQHIVAVELRYAERLASLPVSDYANLPCDSAESLYATHDRAAALFRQLLSTGNLDWDESFDFVTRTLGPARSTRKAVLFHAHLHSIRHYAQLATLVRQHGIPPSWSMDYLALHIERI